MRLGRTILLATAIFAAGTPVFACAYVTANAEAWAQCAYKTAHNAGDHQFMVNLAKAKRDNQKLLPTAGPRWTKLEKRIVASCGSYQQAAVKDRKEMQQSGGAYTPDNAFSAVLETENLSALVKR